MASAQQYVAQGTSAADVTLTGSGRGIYVKSLDGAGIVAVRCDGTAADASGVEGNFYLSTATGDVLYIPRSVHGSVVVSLDATVTTKVAVWLDESGRA